MRRRGGAKWSDDLPSELIGKIYPKNIFNLHQIFFFTPKIFHHPKIFCRLEKKL